ncbi:hypothetical protein QJS10_CPA01g00452 [Acorus calamus]|uniref:CAAX prenyl protease n=1 Tax=Acorus calamus TaxID=4465 RepID=A0AAV9FMB1_ACOCL|nr:hypothetical protein QJS10_CPA01g00452 [Acorus calamus]
MILVYIFETYLDVRQHAAHKLPNLPKPLIGVVTQEKFEKSRAYSLDKRSVFFLCCCNHIMDTAILFYGVLPWFWKTSGFVLGYLGLNPENEILHTLSFLAGSMIWSQITDLPFSLYSTFVIEARHGFNKQTVWTFFKDIFKSMCISILIGPPIVAAIIIIVQKGGPYLAIYLWGFMFLLSVLMLQLYPILIAPLFNKFTPVNKADFLIPFQGYLTCLFPKENLERKLRNLHHPLNSIEEAAYMYGFFNNKRIVLYDTLLQQCKNNDEVVAVIAHELGHWKLNHTVFSFVAIQVSYRFAKGFVFWSLKLKFNELLIIIIIMWLGMGFVSRCHHAYLTVIVLFFCSMLLYQFSIRKFEFQADAFGKKLGYAKELRAGLIKLQVTDCRL